MPLKKSTAGKILAVFCLIGLSILYVEKNSLHVEPAVPDDIIVSVPEETVTIPPPDIQKTASVNFTIVTAASSNHFCALEAMLYSFQELRLDVPASDFPRMVVYNLGLNSAQSEVLKNLYENNYFDELVLFNYKAYPTFWNVRVKRGQYAWKTGAIKEVQEKYGGVVIWLDTGDVPNIQFLQAIPQYIQQHGFWSPRSTGYITEQFNHRGLFTFFNADIHDYETFENCNGAALGFNMDDEEVVNNLFLPWFQCAVDHNCIAPEGSSRKNHRQDQSAISFLAAREGYHCFEYPEFHGLTIHQDDHCSQRLALLKKTGNLLYPSSIDYQ